MINPQRIIENSLILEINNPTAEGIEAYWQCEKALNAFVNQKIGFKEYLEILWENGVDIDDYLILIDDNLRVNEI